MSSLGDVLELIFASPDPAVAVRAVIEERDDAETARRVAEAFANQHLRADLPLAMKALAVPALAVAGGMAVLDRLRGRRPEAARPPESELRIWLDASGRARAERTWPGPTGPESRTAVTAIGADNECDSPLPAISELPFGHVDRWPTPGAFDVERHFDRGLLRHILAGLDLRSARDGVLHGRPVVAVDAVWRRQRLGSIWLPWGADSYELSIDREHGHLLAYAARARDVVYQRATVTEIAYGEPIDPALLTG